MKKTEEDVQDTVIGVLGVIVFIIILAMFSSLKADEFIFCYSHEDCEVILTEAIDSDGVHWLYNTDHAIYIRKYDD